MPPACTKKVSVPQIPQARIRTTTSSGPGTGRSISWTATVPGVPVLTDFMVDTGFLLSCGGRCKCAPTGFRGYLRTSSAQRRHRCLLRTQ